MSSQTFDQLGIRAELSQAAAGLGLVEATPLQSAAIPVLRRGGNLVLHASTGAGVTAAYALPLLDRISQTSPDTEVPRLLIVVPTEDRASRKAIMLGRLANALGLRAAALATGWNRRGEASVVVATAEGARDAVERSELKLGDLVAFVLVDANTQLGDAKDALAALLTSIPREAQRVITAVELNREVDSFVEAHVRKAMNVPARSDDAAARIENAGDLEYVVVPESRKEALLVRLLEQRAGRRPVVVVRSQASGDDLSEALALRGFNVEGGADADVTIVMSEDVVGAAGQISYDVPFELNALNRVQTSGGLVLVTPPELPHLRHMAAQAGFALKAERVQAQASDGLAEYRRMLRQAVHDEDVDAQLAVLDPLFDEFTPAEIAGALSALMRKRIAPRAPSGAGAPTAAGAPRPASAEAGFVRLFFSVGTRDNIRAGDLVGAITGEAGITGDQVGKIDIKDTYTTVELSTAVADKVIRTLNGTTMRSRSLRVDYDRKGAAAREGRDAPASRVGSRDDARSGPRDSARGPRDAVRPPWDGPRGPGRGSSGDGPPKRPRS
ncbi:MAG: DEAD/DEAH box helicase [Longimicrobiales bacterium]